MKKHPFKLEVVEEGQPAEMRPSGTLPGRRDTGRGVHGLTAVGTLSGGHRIADGISSSG